MNIHTNDSAFTRPKTLEWLFFDLNSYFASVEQQDRPELRHKPIAVVPSMTDATCAIAASYEAKAYGIKTGTKIHEAKKLCPSLICVQARHDVYVDYHHRIFEEVGNHIPVTKVCSVDEAACKLWANDKDPVKAAALAERIKAGLRRNIGQYIRCSIGIAPNMFLAKTATDMEKPDGLVILEPFKFKGRLFDLKLTDICGIGHNMERRLNYAGINTVEQFYNLMPKHARKVWGSVEGERLWYKLQGYDVPDVETNKSVIGHSRVLDPAQRSIDKAHEMARHLAVKACTRLRRQNYYARKFSLSVRSTERIYWAREMTFSPSQDNFLILSTLDKLWNQMTWDMRGKKLLKVSVTLYDLYESKEVTLDLFETAQENEKSKIHTNLSAVMDTINQRYGANTLSVGTCPKTSAGYVGTKIAFTRVPEKAEFRE